MKNVPRTIEQSEKLIRLLDSKNTIDQYQDFKNEYITQDIHDTNGDILSIAIKKNNYSCVNFLLNKNDYSDEELYHAMREAVTTGFLHIIKLFFEKKNIPVFTKKYSEKNQTPFKDLLDTYPADDNFITFWHAATASYFIDRYTSIIELLTCDDKNDNKLDNKLDSNDYNVFVSIFISKFEPHHKLRMAMKICDRIKELKELKELDDKANEESIKSLCEFFTNMEAVYPYDEALKETIKYFKIIMPEFKPDFKMSKYSPDSTPPRSTQIFFMIPSSPHPSTTNPPPATRVERNRQHEESSSWPRSLIFL